MTASRAEVRQELAKYLKGAMPSAQEVYHFQKSDFGKASPVVYITSSGSNRQRLTRAGYQSHFKLNVHLWVLQVSKDGAWTEEQAEDALDQLEKELAEACLNVQGSRLISFIEYEGQSNADGITIIGGEPYLHEIVPVVVTCNQ